MGAHYFVFDIEVVGPSDRPDACRIWDIAVMHMVSRRSLTAMVDPCMATYPPPPHPDLFHVTRDFLRANNARPFGEVAPFLIDWIASFGGPGAPVAMVAHGTFLLDKPVLECEFRRLGLMVPPTWYFYDTLPYFRRRFRRMPSYSLKALYQKVFHAPPTSHHFAAADTAALHILLLSATGGDLTSLVGCYCPAYLRPLQNVRYVGSQKEALLFAAGITCYEDLYITLAKTCTLDARRMATFLEKECRIERSSAIKVARSVLSMILREGKGAAAAAAAVASHKGRRARPAATSPLLAAAAAPPAPPPPTPALPPLPPPQGCSAAKSPGPEASTPRPDAGRDGE